MLVVDEMNRGNWLLLMENKHQQTSGFQHVGHAPPPFWEMEEHFRGEKKLANLDKKEWMDLFHI